MLLKKLLLGQFNIQNYRNILNKPKIKVIDKVNDVSNIMINEDEICYNNQMFK